MQKKDRFADVVVSVLDLYARALSPTLSGKSGEVSYGLVGMDFNFLGRGQVVQLTFDHDAITGNRVAALYHLPRLAGTRRTLTTNICVGAEGHDVRLTVSQPFFSLALALVIRRVLLFAGRGGPALFQSNHLCPVCRPYRRRRRLDYPIIRRSDQGTAGYTAGSERPPVCHTAGVYLRPE